MSKHVVALLPFTTPHPFFKAGGVFHPAGLPNKQERHLKGTAKSSIDENKDYSAYGMVKMAADISHTVIATIPPKTTIAGTVLDALLSTFINPDNILAEVDRIEHEDTSIASQIEAAFKFCPAATHVVVIWPYQNLVVPKPVTSPEGEEAQRKSGPDVSFSFTHQMLNFDRSIVPEGYGVLPVTDADSEIIEAKSVKRVADLDELMRGPYTRMITAAEISRSDFDQFRQSPDYPVMDTLMQKSLAGKEGSMSNPNLGSFI